MPGRAHQPGERAGQPRRRSAHSATPARLPGLAGLVASLQRSGGNQAVQRLVERGALRPAGQPAVVQRQENVADDPLKQALGRRAEYFTSNLDLDAAESYLRGLMKLDQPALGDEYKRVKYEIGLLTTRDKKTLVRAVKGVAASPGAGASVDPKNLFQGLEGQRDLVFSHNHPGGTPLSANDIFASFRRGAVEARAVGADGTFVVRVTDGTKLPAPDDGKGDTTKWDAVVAEIAFAYSAGEFAWSSGPGAQYAEHKPIAAHADKELGANLSVDKGMEKLFGCMSVGEKFAGALAFDLPAVDKYLAIRSRYYQTPKVQAPKPTDPFEEPKKAGTVASAAKPKLPRKLSL
jgi:hypothetical protein